MIEGKTVAVVVPAYNEEALIGETLAGIPGFVDRIFVVDDASRDATAERARAAARPARRGDRRTSATAASARRSSPATSARSPSGSTSACVMAGDNQMDPAELETSSARSRAARSTTRRRTASSPAARGR